MDEDELVSVLPIHYSNTIAPNIQIHQFPLLTRPLQAPPSAVKSGKCISARIKPNVRRLEVHIPADTRPEFWNRERGKELGAARVEDDREKNQEPKDKERDDEEPTLCEVRMRSEEIPQRGVHMLGIVRDGKFHHS
jgi:DNA-directed RNA polymerase-3 subunit RPC5